MNSKIYNIKTVCKYISENKSTDEINVLFIEELSELIKPLAKLERWNYGDTFLRCEYKDIIENIYEELADVIIMMFQFIYKNEIQEPDLLNKISEKIIRYYETKTEEK